MLARPLHRVKRKHSYREVIWRYYESMLALYAAQVRKALPASKMLTAALTSA
jgi:hypothetical protein